MKYDLEKLRADLENARLEHQHRGLANCAVRPGFTVEDSQKQSFEYEQSAARVRELEQAYYAACWGISPYQPQQYRKRIEKRLTAYRIEESAEDDMEQRLALALSQTADVLEMTKLQSLSPLVIDACLENANAALAAYRGETG